MDTDGQLALWNGIAPTARETKERRLSGDSRPHFADLGLIHSRTKNIWRGGERYEKCLSLSAVCTCNDACTQMLQQIAGFLSAHRRR